MNNLKLQSFLRLTSKVKVIVFVNGDFCEFISLNGFRSTLKFRKTIEKKAQGVWFEFLGNLENVSSETDYYVVCLQKQLHDQLKKIKIDNPQVLHTKLEIEDLHGHKISPDRLKEDTQIVIQEFMQIQADTIKCLLQKMSVSRNQIIDTDIRWNSSQSNLVELTLALYEGGHVKSKNCKLTKKEFVNHMAVITGVNLDNFDQIAYKLKLREKKSIFLDQLRSVLQDAE